MRARATLVRDGEELRWFAEEDANGNPLALLPLVKVEGWWRELPLMFEPSDLVWQNESALGRLVQQLARQPWPVRLDRVPSTSPTVSAFREAFRGRGVVRYVHAMPTPFVNLVPCHADPESSMSSRRRSDMRRAERKASQLGQVTYEVCIPSDELDAARMLSEALDVESRSWKHDEGTALTSNQPQGGFFADFARLALRSNMLRFAFMRIDGKAVAMQIALEWGQRFWLLKISHDESVSVCSPGQLLIRHTMLQAAHSGLLSYEFMGGMAPWTELWTSEVRDYVTLLAVPWSLASLPVMARMAAARIKQRVRQWNRSPKEAAHG